MMTEKNNQQADSQHESRDDAFMDIDRMISEGLGGGQVTMDNGLIEDTTTDTMDQTESVLDKKEES
jgi:hypothetical protein